MEDRSLDVCTYQQLFKLIGYVFSTPILAVVVVEFDPASYTVTEGGMAGIMVVLRAVISQSISVDFTTQDQSAQGMHERCSYNLCSIINMGLVCLGVCVRECVRKSSVLTL